ncbi:MAG: zf-TFIIB domain-containing protein [Verrucomicrobiota bacterium]
MPLDQSVLRAHGDAGAPISFCETCHGLGLGREQLSRFLKTSASASGLPVTKTFSGENRGFTGPRFCPSCTSVALVVKALDGVEIDFCSRCHGIWLDAGELDLVIARYRRKQKLAKFNRTTFEVLDQASLDPNILSDLIELICEGLGKSSEWAPEAASALLDFIGEAFSSTDF